MSNQLTLFDDFKENDWKEHYFDMPEYNNDKIDEPLMTATFKFRSKEDFDVFHNVVKKYLYENNRVFDGMQRKNIKSAWFPLPPRPSEFNYIDDEE